MPCDAQPEAMMGFTPPLGSLLTPLTLRWGACWAWALRAGSFLWLITEEEVSEGHAPCRRPEDGGSLASSARGPEPANIQEEPPGGTSFPRSLGQELGPLHLDFNVTSAEQSASLGLRNGKK